MRNVRISEVTGLPRVLALALALGLLAPYSAFAGGAGGGANKADSTVRVKNISSSDPLVPLLSLDTVPVGDAGNAAAVVNGSSVGAVATAFRMGKFEITISQYVAFLNAVATRADGVNGPVSESLYDSRMGSDANIAGIVRSGSGTAEAPYIYSAVGDSQKPIAYITWFNAARFANWMHNGATATASIETGAYPLNGALGGTITKNPSAVWWIPSQDEWFKAAYYKGGSATAGYWQFPTQNNSFPGNSSSTGNNQANFQRLGVFSVTQLSVLNATQNYLTAVGSFSAAPGPYGTFDQGGNVEEWTDTVVTTAFGDARITRGGAWNSGGLNSDVNPIPTALPSDRLSKLGFRLARAAIDEGAPVTLSGTFLVSVSSDSGNGALVTLRPGEVRGFGVKRGRFSVFAADATVQTTRATREFPTAGRRTTFITVLASGNQIVLAEAPAGTEF
jgi:sulfatase modifying factor 1